MPETIDRERCPTVFSYGGGVQSTAALVLAAQGQIAYDTFLFCNVGDDSEDPDTLAYVPDQAMPFARAQGVTLLELHKDQRRGAGAVAPETVYGRITRPDTRSIGIPIHMCNGAPGTRQCTLDFKIRVVARWMKCAGYTAGAPSVVGLGISTDEFHLARSASSSPQHTLDYPFIRLWLPCADCLAWRTRGCPPRQSRRAGFVRTTVARWQQMRHERLRLFETTIALERTINEWRGPGRRQRLLRIRV